MDTREFINYGMQHTGGLAAVLVAAGWLLPITSAATSVPDMMLGLIATFSCLLVGMVSDKWKG
jgi:hypothetical protein